jgi:hypothetical protein
MNRIGLAMKSVQRSHIIFVSKVKGVLTIIILYCNLLFTLFRFKVYIMQTFMELIETCINKEPNANANDVNPNVVLFINYCLQH